MSTPTYTEAQLQALRDALAKGEKRVTFGDKTVEYRSIDELTAAIREVEVATLPPEPWLSDWGGDLDDLDDDAEWEARTAGRSRAASPLRPLQLWYSALTADNPQIGYTLILHFDATADE